VSETDWLLRYVELARHVAQWSKDPSTKVGAVVVGRDRRQIAVGYNGFPPGIADTEERLNDRATKYRFTQHAERAVLDNARFDCVGGILASSLHPCVECAKSIVAKRIYLVVCPGMPEDREHWRGDQPTGFYTHSEASMGAEILREAGVDLVYLDNKYRILKR
jgi:dCMP deaminase